MPESDVTSTNTMSTTATSTVPRVQFIERLRDALAGDQVVRLVLGKYRGAEAGLERVMARAVMVKGRPGLSLVYRYRTRDITKNFSPGDAVTVVEQLLAEGFAHAHLVTREEDVQLALNRRGEWRLQRGRLAADEAGEAPVSKAHDREKQRFLDLDRPFLVELGVTDVRQKLIPSMSRKWKQINKFLEIFDHALDGAKLDAGQPLRVVDFGAGKGYLTFALEEYLRSRGLAARVTGMELREDLVRQANDTAVRLKLDNLSFEQGGIGSYLQKAGEASAGMSGDGLRPIDIMIALHACDTATDEAMSLGVRAGAAVIMCAPCCHKELRLQIQSPPMLKPMLRHGIHLGQEAEMVTDSLRALLLEGAGYDTQVFEFVSLEHTSKNKMILAVKRGGGREQALAQVRDIKAFYGIREQRLESLLSPPGRQSSGSGQ